MLVALCYRLHDRDGEKSSPSVRPGHSRLPQQSDQPLPLHDHQQRRQGELQEVLRLQQSDA